MKVFNYRGSEISTQNVQDALDGVFDNVNIFFALANIDIANATTQTTTTLSGAGDDYAYTIKGNFAGAAGKITIRSVDLTLGDSDFKLAGNVSLNVNTGTLSGFYSKVDYLITELNQVLRFSGKLNIDPTTAAPIGGTITSLMLINDSYFLELKGNARVNADLDFTGGTVNYLEITDNQGYRIGFSNLSIKATALNALLDAAQNPTLSELQTFIYSQLKGNVTYMGSTFSDETIIGGNGHDTLDGIAGGDMLMGKQGNDTYFVYDASDTVIEHLNEGTDLVKSWVDYALPDHVENLTLIGNDSINGTGNSLKNTITGNAANNILDGGEGIDTLAGGLGNDTYLVDLVRTGASIMNYKASLEDKVIETAAGGNDTIELRGSIDLLKPSTLTLVNHLENLDASNTGLSLLNLTGNALNNILTGNSANNTILGGAGNDTLIGRLGADKLTGGAGIDYFKYLNAADSTVTEGVDIITDFTKGVDKIDFSALDIGFTLSFSGTTPTAHSAWYAQSASNTFIYVDIFGDATAEMQIQLTGNIGLEATDFVFSI